MNFNNFTTKSQEIIQLAQQLAQSYSHNQIENEHIFKALKEVDENVLPFFNKNFETYVYGNTIDGNFIKSSQLKKILFSDRKIIVHCHRNNEIIRTLFLRFLGAKFKLIATRHSATKPSKMTSFLKKLTKSLL